MHKIVLGFVVACLVNTNQNANEVQSKDTLEKMLFISYTLEMNAIENQLYRMKNTVDFKTHTHL